MDRAIDMEIVNSPQSYFEVDQTISDVDDDEADYISNDNVKSDTKQDVKSDVKGQIPFKKNQQQSDPHCHPLRMMFLTQMLLSLLLNISN